MLFETGIRRLGSKEGGFFYRYRERKEREKFERVLRFADVLPGMRRIASNHLRRKELDRKNVLEAVDAIAHRLGNTRDIARLVHQPAGPGPLHGGVHGSLLRRADGDHRSGTGRPHPRRAGVTRSSEQEAPPRT